MFQRPDGHHQRRLRRGGHALRRGRALRGAPRVATTGPVVLLDDPAEMADPRRAFTTNPTRRVLGGARLPRWLVAMFGGEPDQPRRAPRRGVRPRPLRAARGGDGHRTRSATQEWTVDGHGLRDHSWGPRYWQAPWYYRWLTANFGPDFGFMGSRIARRDGAGTRGGFVWDGKAPARCATTSASAPRGSGERPLPPRDRRRARHRRPRRSPCTGTVLQLIPLRNRRRDPERQRAGDPHLRGPHRWTLDDGRVGLRAVGVPRPDRRRRSRSAWPSSPSLPPWTGPRSRSTNSGGRRGRHDDGRCVATDARAFAGAVAPGSVRVDLGCGAGRYTADLGVPVIGIDAARSMLELCRGVAPHALLGAGGPRGSPLQAGRAARRLGPHELPARPSRPTPRRAGRPARALVVGAPLDIQVLAGDYEGDALPADDVGGRFFASWTPERLHDVLVGAGFDVDGVEVERRRGAGPGRARPHPP